MGALDLIIRTRVALSVPFTDMRPLASFPPFVSSLRRVANARGTSFAPRSCISKSHNNNAFGRRQLGNDVDHPSLSSSPSFLSLCLTVIIVLLHNNDDPGKTADDASAKETQTQKIVRHN